MLIGVDRYSVLGYIFDRFKEPLAQSVEHLPFKQRVVGSIPTRLTILDVPIV